MPGNAEDQLISGTCGHEPQFEGIPCYLCHVSVLQSRVCELERENKLLDGACRMYARAVDDLTRRIHELAEENEALRAEKRWR